jgi:hypothetical protein
MEGEDAAAEQEHGEHEKGSRAPDDPCRCNQLTQHSRIVARSETHLDTCNQIAFGGELDSVHVLIHRNLQHGVPSPSVTGIETYARRNKKIATAGEQMILWIGGQITASLFHVGLENELQAIAEGNHRPAIQLDLVSNAVILRTGCISPELNRREHRNQRNGAHRSLHRSLVQETALERETDDRVG